MALYMFFHVVPDSHIEFLSKHSETFRPYMEGREPEFRRSLFDKLFGREVELNLPNNWPRNELEGFCPEVNHRQIEYFHYLLNGTQDRVHHSGCIFQTWFDPRFKSVAVTIDGENFALKSEDILDLKERIQNISEDELFGRYRKVVDDPSMFTSDKAFLTDAFNEISSACDKALEKKEGLMWTAG